eukprot:GFYU01006923.1.p1 GENE.GFYU01006923.1~~GFYU01006923.1.p1  ORF type:complete len:541 (-),score=114.83 GFYU01006923.1:107-1729(-)
MHTPDTSISLPEARVPFLHNEGSATNVRSSRVSWDDTTWSSSSAYRNWGVAACWGPQRQQPLRERLAARFKAVSLWRVLVITLYLILSALLVFAVIRRYQDYAGSKLEHIIIIVSRSTSLMLNFNCALLLLPLLRDVLHWFRTIPFVSDNVIPLHRSRNWHSALAVVIAVLSVLHTVTYYSKHRIEAVTFNDIAFSTEGVSGHILLIAMIILYSTSIADLQKRNYDLFYWFHGGSTLCFYVVLFIHSRNFWHWALPFVVLYAFERGRRALRRAHCTAICSVGMEHGRVLKLEMARRTFAYAPGDYVYINLPTYSKHGWYPYTLTSSPDVDDALHIHLHPSSERSQQLHNAVSQSMLGLSPANMPMKIDGPFGSGSARIFDREVVVLIAAELGVLPLSSILKSIKSRHQEGSDLKSPKMSYFFWVCSNMESYEWFNDMLCALEEQSTVEYLEINTYATKSMEISNLIHMMCTDEQSGIIQLTSRRQPMLDHAFTFIKKKHSGQDIGVYCSGPEKGTVSVQRLAQKHQLNFGRIFAYGEKSM